MTKIWLKGFTLALFIFSESVLIASTSTAVNAEGVTKDAAVQQIQIFYDALLDSMKHAREYGIQGRYDKLKPVIEQTFDLETMTRLAVGPSWQTIPADKQRELISALKRVATGNYAHDFNKYNGEKFSVESPSIVRGQDRLVRSELVLPDKSTVPFIYRMRQPADTWKVIDIFLNGYVSEVSTWRSDFSSTIATGGADALIKKLNQLADGLLKDH